MTIENEIKNLKIAMEELTIAIKECKEYVVTSKIDEGENTFKELNTDTANNPKITNDMVKQLGKQKMAEGVERSKIKEIISSFVGEEGSIIDLNESNIEECYNKINELQPK